MNNKKLIWSIPAILSTSLIIYISRIFAFEFLPYQYPDYTTVRYLIQIPFYYFSLMTLVCIFMTAASDPGYLSVEYQHPLTHEGYAPLRQLRVHNMRMFIKYKLYDFSNNRADEESYSLVEEAGTELNQLPTKMLTEQQAIQMDDKKW